MLRTTSFTTRSDDKDNLWPVHQIIAQSATKCKVKWVGVDPAIEEPWAPSWMPKFDCMGDLMAK